jgi:signal transduction histidine kinase
MIRWRAVALIVAVLAAGALGTLVVGAALGMGTGELAHLLVLIVPAALATIVAVLVTRPLLSRSPIRHQLAAIAVIAALAGLVNVTVLATLMVVSDHDARLIAILLAYSTGVGISAAWVLARCSAAAIDRLASTARLLGAGDLTARTGRVEAAPELEELGRAFDDMADRLQSAITRERDVEARRRDLMTAVSHDLRTPLASLRAMVEAVDEGVVEDVPTFRRYAVEMRRSVDSLVLLVDDLFELAQLDAGAIEAEVERARLEDVVRSAVATCRMQAVQKGLVLQTNLNGADGVQCSPRLVRVLQNLLSNAIRHTPGDGTVRIEARRGPSGLEVAVEDTGEGIPDESLERVFDPFWRGDPARSGPGAGLGLALAKRIVEALGGSIVAENRPAHGARFALVLPDRQA